MSIRLKYLGLAHRKPPEQAHHKWLQAERNEHIPSGCGLEPGLYSLPFQYKSCLGVPVMAQPLTDLTGIHEDVASIPGIPHSVG